MNEQIKQIAEQLGYDWNWSNQTDFGPKEMEQFAKLLIKECAKRVDYWESWQGEHSEDLLKHFGIT